MHSQGFSEKHFTGKTRSWLAKLLSPPRFSGCFQGSGGVDSPPSLRSACGETLFKSQHLGSFGHFRTKILTVSLLLNMMLGVGDCQCFIFGSNPICIPGINLTLLTCMDELNLLNILYTIMLQLFMSDTPGPISCQMECPGVLLASFQRHLEIT